jgi:hypothetical protein
MHMVQYTTFMMVMFHSNIPARLWHGSKKLQGILFTTDSKVAWVEPPSLITPACWDT